MNWMYATLRYFTTWAMTYIAVSWIYDVIKGHGGVSIKVAQVLLISACWWMMFSDYFNATDKHWSRKEKDGDK